MAIHSLQAELKRLRQALDAHGKALEAQRRTFENLENALVGFQEALLSEATEHPEDPNGKGMELLSIAQLCQIRGLV